MKGHRRCQHAFGRWESTVAEQPVISGYEQRKRNVVMKSMIPKRRWENLSGSGQIACRIFLSVYCERVCLLVFAFNVK